MAVDWDAVILAPVMGIFGEGIAADQSSWPLYTPRGRAAFRLADAIFDEQYEHTVINDAGEPSTTRRPVIGVRLALFDRDPAQNDKLMIPANGRTYIVKDVQPDGHGCAKLILMEAAR